MKFELKDICFFDCETTGVPARRTIGVGVRRQRTQFYN